jgi:hypothetical protein
LQAGFALPVSKLAAWAFEKVAAGGGMQGRVLWAYSLQLMRAFRQQMLFYSHFVTAPVVVATCYWFSLLPQIKEYQNYNQ